MKNCYTVHYMVNGIWWDNLTVSTLGKYSVRLVVFDPTNIYDVGFKEHKLIFHYYKISWSASELFAVLNDPKYGVVERRSDKKRILVLHKDGETKCDSLTRLYLHPNEVVWPRVEYPPIER